MMSMQNRVVDSGWQTAFPMKCDTEVRSLAFMKKLVAIAISNITYLRTIFPESAYGNRQIGDVKLKILSEESGNEGVHQLIEWIRGCFDPLEKKYLRQLMLGIHTDSTDPDNVIESYSFRFEYGKDNHTTVTCNNEKLCSMAADGTSMTEDTIRKSTLSLLRTCIILTSSLKPLPEEAFLTMKLLYYDENTPPEYEPPGFTRSKTDNFFYKGKPVNIKVGEVSTPFHTFKMRAKTVSPEFNDILNEAHSRDNSEATSEPSTNPLNAETIDETNQPMLKIPIVEIISEDPNECESQDALSDGETNVKCPCLDEDNDGIMIECSICSSWQHMFCFGLTEDLAKNENHVCSDCADPNDPSLKPTDPNLQALDPDKRRFLCLFRRALQICLEDEQFVFSNFRKRLSIKRALAQSLLTKLQDEGFVVLANGNQKGKRLTCPSIINSKGISQYFKGANKNSTTEIDLTQSPMEPEDIRNLRIITSRMAVNDDIPKTTRQGRSSERNVLSRSTESQDSGMSIRSKEDAEKSKNSRSQSRESNQSSALSNSSGEGQKRGRKRSVNILALNESLDTSIEPSTTFKRSKASKPISKFSAI